MKYVTFMKSLHGIPANYWVLYDAKTHKRLNQQPCTRDFAIRIATAHGSRCNAYPRKYNSRLYNCYEWSEINEVTMPGTKMLGVSGIRASLNGLPVLDLIVKNAEPRMKRPDRFTNLLKYTIVFHKNNVDALTINQYNYLKRRALSKVPFVYDCYNAAYTECVEEVTIS